MFADEMNTPNHDFVSRLRVVTRKIPEEKLSCLILVVGDGQKTCVAFADVPRNIRKSASVDSERWYLSGQYNNAVFRRLTRGGLVEESGCPMLQFRVVELRRRSGFLNDETRIVCAKGRRYRICRWPPKKGECCRME